MVQTKFTNTVSYHHKELNKKLCELLGHSYVPNLHTYCTNWAITGPLVQKYHISLNEIVPNVCWEARTKEKIESGSTALTAIVKLLIKLLENKNGTH